MCNARGKLFNCWSRSPEGVAAAAVAAMKGGKVVGIVVTDGGSGYAEASLPYYCLSFLFALSLQIFVRPFRGGKCWKDGRILVIYCLQSEV